MPVQLWHNCCVCRVCGTTLLSLGLVSFPRQVGGWQRWPSAGVGRRGSREPPSFLLCSPADFNFELYCCCFWKEKKKTCYGPSSLLAYLLAQFPSNLLSFVLSFPSFLPPSPPYFPSFSPQLTHLPLLLILLSLLLLPHLLPVFFYL